jgi:hypothetical protein
MADVMTLQNPSAVRGDSTPHDAAAMRCPSPAELSGMSTDPLSKAALDAPPASARRPHSPKRLPKPKSGHVLVNDPENCNQYIGSIDITRCEFIWEQLRGIGDASGWVYLCRTPGGRFCEVTESFPRDSFDRDLLFVGTARFITDDEAARWFMGNPGIAPECLRQLASTYDLTAMQHNERSESEEKKTAPEARSRSENTMRRVISYCPLDGIGEVRLDVDDFKRRLLMYRQDENDPDYPTEGPLETWIYVTPDRRLVEHTTEYDANEQGPGEIFREVCPAYVVQELALHSKQLPADLAWLQPHLDAQKLDPWIMYGPTAPAPAKPSPRDGGTVPRASRNPQSTDAGSQPPWNGSSNLGRNLVFVSYSHHDTQFLDQLQTHLKPFVRRDAITVWSDMQIQPGSKWLEEIKAALAKTAVAIMLVTPSFLASDFIHEHELGPVLTEAAAGGVKILWVLIRDCAYNETPLKDYQAVVSPPGKPFALMKADRDTAWRRVCESIAKAVNQP